MAFNLNSRKKISEQIDPVSDYILVGNDRYVWRIGGRNTDGVVNGIYKLDLNDNSFIKTGVLNTPKSNAGGILISNDIYIFGGETIEGNILNTLEKISLMGNKRTILSNIPISLKNVSVVQKDEDTLFIAGGETEEGLTNRCFKYNISTDTFTEISSLVEKRTDFGLVNLNGEILAVCGRVSENNYTDTIEMYDEKNDRWFILDKLPMKISKTSNIIFHNSLYIMGGITGDNEISKNIVVYRPNGEVSILVNSLSYNDIKSVFIKSKNEIIYLNNTFNVEDLSIESLYYDKNLDNDRKYLDMNEIPGGNPESYKEWISLLSSLIKEVGGVTNFYETPITNLNIVNKQLNSIDKDLDNINTIMSTETNLVHILNADDWVHDPEKAEYSISIPNKLSTQNLIVEVVNTNGVEVLTDNKVSINEIIITSLEPFNGRLLASANYYGQGEVDSLDGYTTDNLAEGQTNKYINLKQTESIEKFNTKGIIYESTGVSISSTNIVKSNQIGWFEKDQFIFNNSDFIQEVSIENILSVIKINNKVCSINGCLKTRSVIPKNTFINEKVNIPDSLYPSVKFFSSNAVNIKNGDVVHVVIEIDNGLRLKVLTDIPEDFILPINFSCPVL